MNPLEKAVALVHQTITARKALPGSDRWIAHGSPHAAALCQLVRFELLLINPTHRFVSDADCISAYLSLRKKGKKDA